MLTTRRVSMANIKTFFKEMTDGLKSRQISNWSDISNYLDEAAKRSESLAAEEKDLRKLFQKGAAFITYDFGIDGVSIEIFKYAQCLEKIIDGIPLHFIGGDFYDKADVVLKPYWKRFEIDGINGWSKWDDGKWFSKLYYEDMPEGSAVSDEMAVEMWKQASCFAEKLGGYLAENDINLLIPVNIPTNPGNFAAMLAIIIATENLGTYVISSNHDYYWEGGKPECEKEPGEEPGVRDHFFKNYDNKSFFSLFKRMYPWNGKRWLQVNINTPQSEALVEKFGFAKDRVYELGTAISDKFFEAFDAEDVKSVRKRMAYILSDGKPTIDTVPIKKHLADLSSWMTNQKPIACGYSSNLILDPTKNKTIYCLQPTRVIARKRIEMDLHLLKALMNCETFRLQFEKESYQLVLHITGPVPIEHQEDLETVLNAYINLCESLPESIAKRIFITFSVGTENHPSFAKNNLEPLCIEEIYRLATLILFPSETEGRGLPIVESSACGIPIVCSRYFPEEVFAEVVGEKLADEKQIKYVLFPEPDAGFSDSCLDAVSDLMLCPEKSQELIKHNKKAVKLRYSTEMIKKKFEEFITRLETV
jgi:glycosyltransferase involved in cell wall biosynthesis